MSINWTNVTLPDGLIITNTTPVYTLISTDDNLNSIFILCLIGGYIYEFRYNDITGMVEYYQSVYTIESNLVSSITLSRYSTLQTNKDLLYITTITNRTILLYSRTVGLRDWVPNINPISTESSVIINCVASTKTGNYLYCGGSSNNITPFYFNDDVYIGYDENKTYSPITLDSNKGQFVNMVCSDDGEHIAWFRLGGSPQFFYKNGVNGTVNVVSLSYGFTVNTSCNEQLSISKNYSITTVNNETTISGKIIFAQSKYNLWEYNPPSKSFNLVKLSGSNNQNYTAISLDNTGLNSVMITTASLSTNNANPQYLPFVASSADELKTSYNIMPLNEEFVSSTVGLSCCVSPNYDINTFKPLVSIIVVSTGPDGNILFSLNGGGSCFIKGTEIIILKNGIETIEKVEKLKNGDLVKTSNNSFKPINFIGYNDIDIKRNMDYIYVLRKDAYKENVPNKDLLIVGGHSLLFDNLENINNKFTPNIYNNNIDNYYKIMASQCSLCENASFEDIVDKLSRNTIKYYHFALEDENKDLQHAIYSNGMLSETMSINYSKKSGLVELKSSVVNRNCC